MDTDEDFFEAFRNVDLSKVKKFKFTKKSNPTSQLESTEDQNTICKANPSVGNFYNKHNERSVSPEFSYNKKVNGTTYNVKTSTKFQYKQQTNSARVYDDNNRLGESFVDGKATDESELIIRKKSLEKGPDLLSCKSSVGKTKTASKFTFKKAESSERSPSLLSCHTLKSINTSEYFDSGTENKTMGNKLTLVSSPNKNNNRSNKLYKIAPKLSKISNDNLNNELSSTNWKNRINTSKYFDNATSNKTIANTLSSNSSPNKNKNSASNKVYKTSPKISKVNIKEKNELSSTNCEWNAKTNERHSVNTNDILAVDSDNKLSESFETSECKSDKNNTSNTNCVLNNRTESSDSEFSSSPIIKPKKFVFKKKLSSSSLGTLSQLTDTSLSPKNTSTRNSSHISVSNSSKKSESPSNSSKKSESPKSTQTRFASRASSSQSIESPKNIIVRHASHISINSTDSEKSSPSKTRSRRNNSKIEDTKKNLFENDFILNDEVTCISQRLEATDADYMDDEEFERMFGSLADELENSEISNNASKIADQNTEEIMNEISDVNWDEDLTDEPQTSSTSNFNNRVDDSDGFTGSYPHSEVMLEVLHQKFGLRKFRPHQREIINASLVQHDCFVLMPTGGGKSLCYQLPAVLMPGVTIVISPLRALISDQVDKLNALDISAAHLCSDVSMAESSAIMAKMHTREPTIKLLYLTPEKISASKMVVELLDSLYSRGKLARFVIDEVHCLSQWGHDFRPDYKQLSLLRKKYKDVPIICLTATATKQVENDVVNILGLTNVKRFIRSFNRPNIKYQVVPKTGKKTTEAIASLIKQKFSKKSGIVYCLCRKDCDFLAEELNRLGIKSKPYHAGMRDKVREVIQREWMQDRFHVIVATIAFGMGIDKPDVRFVIHNSIPKSVEAFYQESGRAGRDGETSYSYLFYSYGDVGRLQRLMMQDKKVSTKTVEAHFENLNQMVAFAENVVDCRRYLQLIHLGERFDRKICIQNKDTICDNCENIDKYKVLEVTKEAKELCALVRDIAVKEKVTLLHIVDIYKGSKIKKIMEKGHNRHKYFGAGSNLDRTDLQRILKQMVLRRILGDYCTYTGEFPVVYIKPGPKFNSISGPDINFTIPVASNRTVKGLKTQNDYPELDIPVVESPKPSSSNKKIKTPASNLQIAQIKVQCHEDLLEECRRLAMEKNTTLSSIMNLSAIKNMSDVLPDSKEEFLKIQHVTDANYKKYGEYFLKITKKYRDQVDALQFVGDFDADDFVDSCSWTSSQTKTGVKRKPKGGYRGGGKRFKRSANRKPKVTRKRGSPKSKGGWKTKRKVTSGAGGLGLMPLHIK